MYTPLYQKREVFGEIAAFTTLTDKYPKFSNTSSYSSVNNGGDSISFLSDLVKSLIGYENMVLAVEDTISRIAPKIENRIKIALKRDLKTLVSCGVDPSVPIWLRSTGTGINAKVKNIDFMDILRTDPASSAGNLLYSDITTPYTNSTDFNTFLFGVIQNDNTTYSWRNIIDVTFNSLGTGTRPNNSITIKSNQIFDNKKLTDLNNEYIDSLTLFNTDGVITKVIDIIHGSVSFNVGKSLKQLELEEKINHFIDKITNNNNKGSLPDDAFSFSNLQLSEIENRASNRAKAIKEIYLSTPVPSQVPMSDLTNYRANYNSATNDEQRRLAVINGLKNMANSAIQNVRGSINTNIGDVKDKATAKLNFIQEIINNLTKAIINMVISPKVILIFYVNFKIINGPNATITDFNDFFKKNKNLLTEIMKEVSEEIIKILLEIALKEISKLVSKYVLEVEKEKATLKLAQVESLFGIPSETLRGIINSVNIQ